MGSNVFKLLDTWKWLHCNLDSKNKLAGYKIARLQFHHIFLHIGALSYEIQYLMWVPM